MKNDSELISLDTGEIKRRIFAIRGEAGDAGKKCCRFLQTGFPPGKEGMKCK